MNAFSLYLKKMESELGFQNSKSFYNHLASLGNLNFNYTYFMKIEAGKQTPSPMIVERLASLLPKLYQDGLYLAYCSTLFPEKENLFILKNQPTTIEKKEEYKTLKEYSNHEEIIQLKKSSYFSILQLEMITRTKLHCFFFYLILQANKALTKNDLQTWFSPEEILILIENFKEARMIHGNEEDGYQSSVNSLKFPPADNEYIKNLYRNTSEWEYELPSFFKLQPQVTRTLFKRCTKKQLELLKLHAELLIQLARATEDSNPDLNQDVFFININFSSGNLPG